MLEFHEEHPSIVAMKAIARSYIWWLNLNEEIQFMVKGCEVCQSVQKAAPAAPLYPWKCLEYTSILQRRLAITSLE